MAADNKILLRNAIGTRLAMVIALFGLGMIAVIALLSWMDAQTIQDARRDQLRNAIKLAYNVVDEQYKEFKAGKKSEAEAQEAAKAAVRAMRYNESDYFFVQDDKVVTIVHGARPDQEGMDGTKQTDATGKLFSVEMHDVAVNKGEGTVDYLYAKPGADMKDAIAKRSFVKYFEPWKWVIGTGVYINDLTAQIWQRTMMSMGVGAIVLLLIGAAAALTVRRLTRRLRALSQSVAALAQGDNNVALPLVERDDEIGRVTKALHVFKDAAIEKMRLEGEAERTRRQADTEQTAREAEKAHEAHELQTAIDALSEGLSGLSRGDLLHNIDQPFQPKVDKLRLDFNAAVGRLRETMISVGLNATAMRTGSTEISTAADDLSRRTEQQAASLEETAAALDEITVTVKKTAEGANHARKVVSAAKADAQHSGSVVRQAVDAMSAIEKSAHQVSQIIGVIDEIAFQTNLLALNAGVEAARAGEAGRGFAVVASEVRGLAQRSAEAAKEIKALISASGQQVAQGVDLVGETGRALERILNQVAEINGIVDDIAASAHEQSSGLQQVNTAINQMDQVTQQNAAMVEQSTAASHSLAQEAGELARLIGGFQIGSHTASAPLARVAARAASRPMPAMKATGRGGAARKVEPSSEESWTEF